jgi:DNA-binding XRE family transcriptional regulator
MTNLPDIDSLSLRSQIAQMIVVRASGFLYDHQIQYPQWELPHQTLSKLIKDARLERGMSQKQLAEAIGVKTTQVSRIELNYEAMTLKTLTKYLEYFGFSLIVL